MKSNDTLPNDNTDDPLELNKAYIYSFYASLVIIGVVGNALVVLGFLTKRKLLKLATNLFIFHLGIVNLVTVVTITPMYMGSPEVLGKVGIKFRDIFYPISIAIAQHTLSLIAATRWMTVGITRGKIYHQICRGRGVCMVLTTMWMVTVIITVPLWVDYDIMHYNKEQNYKLITYVVFSVLPTFLLVPLFNFLTLKILRKSRKRVRNRQEDGRKAAPHKLRKVPSVSFIVGTNYLTAGRTNRPEAKPRENNSCYSISQIEAGEDGEGPHKEHIVDIEHSGFPGQMSRGDDTPHDFLHREQEFSNGHPRPSLIDIVCEHDGASAFSEHPFFIVVASASDSATAPTKITAAEEDGQDIAKKRGVLAEHRLGEVQPRQIVQDELLDEIDDQLQKTSEIDGHVNNRKHGNQFAVRKEKVKVARRAKIFHLERGEVKIMRLTLSMCLLLAISSVPTMIAMFNPSSDIVRILHQLTYLVPLFPSLVPYLYIFSHRHLRKWLQNIASKVVLFCCSTSKPPSGAEPM